MSDPLSPLDPLEELFARPLPAVEDAARRQALREQTSRIVRRHGRIRRIAMVASWLAFFVAGAGAMQVWNRVVTAPDEPPEHARAPAIAPEKERPSTPEAKGADNPLLPALAQEWQAFDARENRPELYLQAGRRYLEENQDYASALRCYTRALDTGDLTVSAEDDWLLLALKIARRKEKNYAHVDH